MADNATIRIILDGTGTVPGAQSPTQVAPPLPRPTPAAPQAAAPQPSTGLSPRVPRAARIPDIGDEAVDVARTYRRLLSSVFGSFVGSILDMVMALRKTESEMPTARPATQPAAPVAPTFPATEAAQSLGVAAGAMQPSSTGIQQGPTPAATFPQIQAKQFNTNVTAGAGGASMMTGIAAGVGIAGAVLAGLSALKGGLYSATQAAGSFAALITADTSPANYISTLGTAAKSASDSIFMVNPVLSIFGSTVGGATQAMGQFMRAVDAQVDRYSGLEPNLAVATALGELSVTLQDFRRAREISPDLIRYVQARTELQNRFEDTKIKLLERIVPPLTDMMETLNRIWPVIDAGFQSATAIVQGVFNVVDMLTGIGTAVQGIASMMPDPNRGDDDFVLPTDAVLNGFPWDLPREGGG
jgi:hypothetical protein